MKIRVLRSVIANGKDLRKGQIYEIDDKTAKTLIFMGKAEEVKSGKK